MDFGSIIIGRKWHKSYNNFGVYFGNDFQVFSDGSTETGKWDGATGDLFTTGCISTKNHEFLATDIIRHTLDAGEAAAGTFTEADYNTTTIAKMVSITTSLNDAGAIFLNEAATMVATYDGADIVVTE